MRCLVVQNVTITGQISLWNVNNPTEKKLEEMNFEQIKMLPNWLPQ